MEKWMRFIEILVKVKYQERKNNYTHENFEGFSKNIRILLPGITVFVTENNGFKTHNTDDNTFSPVTTYIQQCIFSLLSIYFFQICIDT